MNKRALVLAMVGMLLLSGSANALPLSPDDLAARDIALHWLRLVDGGHYREAVLETSWRADTLEHSQQVAVMDHWLKYLAGHRQVLGPVAHRILSDLKHTGTVPGAPESWRYDIFHFKTSYATKRAAMEEVLVSKLSGRWRVAGYTIYQPGKLSQTQEHAGEFSDPSILGQ